MLAIASRTTTSAPVLLTCVVPDGACTVAADHIGTFDELGAGTFVLPFGTLPDN